MYGRSGSASYRTSYSHEYPIQLEITPTTITPLHGSTYQNRPGNDISYTSSLSRRLTNAADTILSNAAIISFTPGFSASMS